MSTEPSLEDLRELLTIVTEARQSASSTSAIRLESSLVVYRPHFANLLKDQPKNQTNREAIKAGKRRKTCVYSKKITNTLSF
jgi:hypothetical protein